MASSLGSPVDSPNMPTAARTASDQDSDPDMGAEPERPELRIRKSFDTLLKRKKSSGGAALVAKKSFDRTLNMPVSRSGSGRSRKGTLEPAALVEEVEEDDDSSGDRPKPRDDAGTGQRLAGFAYTTKKRNQDFHKLFRSLPLHDFLLDDFSCALNREILIQGRMYISERHICFNSNILGWVTNLIISFHEIVGLEKKTTAGLFPNGIIVQTLRARHSFASFISRDSVFDFIMSVWKQTTARSDMALADEDDLQLDGFIEDDDEEEDVFEATGSSDLGESDEEYDEDGSLDEFESESEISVDEEFGASAKAAAVESSPAEQPATEAPPDESTAVKWPVTNLGPEIHAATDPEFDYEGAGEKLLISETIAAPLGVVANMLFGSDTKWISNFIVEKEKNIDLKPMTGFEGGLSPGEKRSYEYVKPLGGPVGPKQTRCLLTETIETWNLDSHVAVLASTQTPDVPSGGSFLTKTRYTLSWASKNHTRVLLTYLVDWSAKSWFKGPIEKGTHDGQMAFAKNLIKELKADTRRPGAGAKQVKAAGDTAAGTKKKAKKEPSKKRRKSKMAVEAPQLESAWSFSGMLNALSAKPLTFVSLPLWSLILIAVLLYLQLSSWLFFPTLSRTSSRSFNSLEDRLNMIRLEEEYKVWRWIGDRTDFAGLSSSDYDLQWVAQVGQQRSAAPGEFDRAEYEDQELREVIKLTELRLRELKIALLKK